MTFNLVAACGKNEHFCLGLNDEILIPLVDKPKVAPAFWDVEIKHISCGRQFGCAITDKGKLLTWGRNITGDLDSDYSTPIQVGLDNIARVSCGESHAAAISVTGDVYMWGWEVAKPFRVDEECDETILEKPKHVLHGLRIRDVICGPRYTAAIDCQGRLYMWGLGTGGRLGQGDESARVEPTQVEMLSSYSVRQVALGKHHMLALTDDGHVFVWGSGQRGCLGLGRETLASPVPAEIRIDPSFGKPVGVACGDAHSICWTESGAILAWGCSANFRLGFDCDDDVFTPTAIPAVQNVIYATCGVLHTCAILGDPQETCLTWGGLFNPESSTRVLTTHCRAVACGNNFIMVYTGLFASSLSVPFFPRLRDEEVDLVERAMLDHTESRQLVMMHIDVMSQQLGHIIYHQATLESVKRQAEKDSSFYANDPLCGAEVEIDIRILGFRAQTATEHSKDRQHFQKKDKAKAYELLDDQSSGLDKYLVF